MKSLYVLLLAFAAFLSIVPYIQPAQAQGPYLQYAKDYSFYSEYPPYGKLNVIVSIYKLVNDGSQDYDWYFYEVKIQTVPGMVAYGNTWQTVKTIANHTVHAIFNGWLFDYDPTTTNPTYSWGVSASVSLDGPGFTWSWSYDVSAVSVIDQSDFSVHRAKWIHNFLANSLPATNTYLAKPGFVVKTLQDYPSLVDGWYEVTWRLWVSGWGWVYYTTGFGPVYLDAYLSG